MAARKVMVSLSDEALARIDAEASRRRLSRSAYLEQAANRDMPRPTAAELDELLRRGRRILAKASPFDPAQAIREERDALDARDRRRR